MAKSDFDYAWKEPMKYLNVVRLAASALLLISSAVHAQYVWVDSKGTKHFSDLPPPPGTPGKNVLKAPDLPRTGDGMGPATAAPASTDAAAAPGATPSLADREADYRKRTSAKAEQDKKLAEQARVKAQNAQACAAARATTAALATGGRVSVTGANGERVIIDDAQRAQRGAQAAQVLSACK